MAEQTERLLSEVAGRRAAAGPDPATGATGATADLTERLVSEVAGGRAAVGPDPTAGAAGATTELIERLVSGVAGGRAAAGLDPATEATGATTELTERLLGDSAGGLGERVASLGEKLSELARVSQSQARTVEDNTAALAQNTFSKAADAVKSAVGSMGGGLGVLSAGPAFLPLISGIAKLFGGGKTESPPALVTYTRPASLQVEAGIAGDNSGGGISYDANGTPRLDERRAAVPAPQININVQAMDSRSFLDHSEEIARAVRTAMLESHMLGDVLNEL